jgi:hypothetical protein
MPDEFKCFICLFISFLIFVHIRIVLYLFEHFNPFLVVAIGAFTYLFIFEIFFNKESV